jgi:hypothetical protein
MAFWMMGFVGALRVLSRGGTTMKTATIVWLVAAVLAGCGGAVEEPAALESRALSYTKDQPFWRDPGFPGSTDYSGWYDSDVPWGRGSLVRLPVDARYVGNWWTTTYCTGGGTAVMNSPMFQATVSGVTRNFVFNHMIQNQFAIPWKADQAFYNGGAAIGVTGGTLCDEGYPTHSSGNHFCNEVHGDDPYHFWNGAWSFSSSTSLPYYQSSCNGSDGSSGIGNPVCGPLCGSRHCAVGDWCGAHGQCCSGCGPGCLC